MSMTSSKLLKCIPVILTLCLAVAGLANDNFQYFTKDIDYWNERHSKQDAKLETRKAPTPDTPKEQFSWNKYLDPKNKEFFKEGDYTPPEPFQELVRNPSDENLKMWFAYVDKKNQLFTRLQKRMVEFAGRATPESRRLVQAKAENFVSIAPDAKRFRFRVYFDSTCPHCHRMFGTLQELQDKGFLVEARQVDSRPAPKLPIPTEYASKDEIKSKSIQTVPLLLIGDLKKKVVYQMTGYQSVQSIFSEISQQGM